MKIRENVVARWSLQCKDFESDETGREFLKFLTAWCDAAEELYDRDNTYEELPNGNCSGSARSVRSCFMEALDIVEKDLGVLDGTFLGAMIMYICGSWIHGEALVDQLSQVELKVVGTAIAQETALMEKMAEGMTKEQALHAMSAQGVDESVVDPSNETESATDS